MRRICGILNDILKTRNASYGLPPKIGFGVYADDEHQVLLVRTEDLKGVRGIYKDAVPDDLFPERYNFVFEGDTTQTGTIATFTISKGELDYYVAIYPKGATHLNYAEVQFSKKADFSVKEKIPTIPSNFHGLRVTWYKYMLTGIYNQNPSIKMNYKNVEVPFANGTYNLTNMFDAVHGEIDLSHWRIKSTNKTKAYMHNFGFIHGDTVFYLPIFEGKAEINMIASSCFALADNVNYCIFVGKHTRNMEIIAYKCNMQSSYVCKTFSEAKEKVSAIQKEVINSQLLGTYDKKKRKFLILYEKEG